MFRLTLKTFLIIAALLVVIIFFVLPLELPYTIDTPGKILPAKEWIISKSTSGQLITVIKDNKKGISQNYSVSEFERGDAIQLAIHPDLKLGSSVKANDTIASILSNEIQLQLTQLNGQLETARANLYLNISGEKEPIIREAEERLSLMKKQAEEQQKILARQKALFDKKLISQEEFEVTQGTAELNQINIAIAEAQLQSVKSGSKQEQIEYIKSQMRSYENEIDVIKNRLTNYNLISPIAGVVNQMSSGDTICVIADLKEYIIIMPVNWEERMNIAAGEDVLVKIPSEEQKYAGTLQSITNDVKFLNGNQVIFVTASLKGNFNNLLPGLMVQCEINCGKITVAEHFKKFFNTMLN